VYKIHCRSSGKFKGIGECIIQLYAPLCTISTKRHIPSQRRVTYDRSRFGKERTGSFGFFLHRSLRSFSTNGYQPVIQLSSRLELKVFSFISNVSVFQFRFFIIPLASDIDISALNHRHRISSLGHLAIWSLDHCQKL